MGLRNEAGRGEHREVRPSPGLRQLDCLLYQLTEGDVPERPLFEALARMRRILADRVLESVPSYASAPWGVA